jgi:hypothetical protein
MNLDDIKQDLEGVSQQLDFLYDDLKDVELRADLKSAVLEDLDIACSKLYEAQIKLNAYEKVQLHNI